MPGATTYSRRVKVNYARGYYILWVLLLMPEAVTYSEGYFHFQPINWSDLVGPERPLWTNQNPSNFSHPGGAIILPSGIVWTRIHRHRHCDHKLALWTIWLWTAARTVITILPNTSCHSYIYRHSALKYIDNNLYIFVKPENISTVKHDGFKHSGKRGWQWNALRKRGSQRQMSLLEMLSYKPKVRKMVAIGFLRSWCPCHRGRCTKRQWVACYLKMPRSKWSYLRTPI